MKIIKEYKQGFKLGGGKDSKCYLVSKDRKTFCMKKIKVAKNEEKRISKIEREIEIMKIVGCHKNIINLEDSFRLEKGEFWIYCIITEAQRMNLAQYIKSKRDGRLKEKNCKKIFKQILEVIEFLHLNLICHNDLKLENIMIDPDTLDIKLIDFGMSTMHHCEEDMKHMSELCGSPIYLSPEKFSMSQYDGRNADLWATGVVLYKMVSSYFPFQHSDLMGLCRSICEDELQLLDDFSDSLSSLLMKLLCKDPFGRISATDALQQEWLGQKVSLLNSSANCLFNSPLRLENDVGNKPFITFPSSF